ncbi:MAG: hypothetical protein Q4F27_04590 [Desulfovibrionaceae bacterium]|nr:hypothetical protein [Desulfovibrionaceae bacterium]
MFSIMLFIFLCFLGIVALFYHQLRSQERMWHSLREEHARILAQLQALSQAAGLPTEDSPSSAEGASSSSALYDPYSRLSFDEPPFPVEKAASKHDPALDLHLDTPPRRD